MLFCSLIKGITHKIHMLCFVLINSILLIIIMEICKAPRPTLQLKALNKHSIMHIMYLEMENVIMHS